MATIVGVDVIHRRSTVDQSRTLTLPKIRRSRRSGGVSNQNQWRFARRFWFAPARCSCRWS
jgi:hypothetical protein